MEEYFKQQSIGQPSGGVWDEDGQMVVIQHDIPCPLCRQNIGGRDEWTPVDEVIRKMKDEMQQFDKRFQVSDNHYQDRLKKKDKQLSEMSLPRDYYQWKMMSMELRMKAKDSPIFKRSEEYISKLKEIKRKAADLKERLGLGKNTGNSPVKQSLLAKKRKPTVERAVETITLE